MSETSRCKAIKVGGERCSARAQRGSDWCYNHDPARAGERRTNASAGGKARSRRPPDELEQAKREIRAVTAGVLGGKVDKGVGAIVLQGLNTFLRAVEVQRKLDGMAQLEDQVEELRARLEAVRRSGRETLGR